MNANPECFFFIRIKAPSGLLGIEDHSNECELNLEPWRSGYIDDEYGNERYSSSHMWEVAVRTRGTAFESAFGPRWPVIATAGIVVLLNMALASSLQKVVSCSQVNGAFREFLGVHAEGHAITLDP